MNFTITQSGGTYTWTTNGLPVVTLGGFATVALCQADVTRFKNEVAAATVILPPPPPPPPPPPTAGITFAGGIITISTDGPGLNEAKVQIINLGSGDLAVTFLSQKNTSGVVVLSQSRWDIPLASVTSIVFRGEAGRDNTFQNFTSKPCTAFGGTGTNLLIGGGGNDTLTAGPAGSTNTLQGVAGNDTLIGGAGTTYFYGGLGTNTCTGGSGTNIFVAGPGTDTFIPGSGTNIYI